MNIDYASNLKNFKTKNGLSSFFLLLMICCSTFLHGFIFTTNLPLVVLQTLSTIWPLFDFFIVILFLNYFKESISTVGLTSSNLKIGLQIGAISSVALLLVYLGLSKLVNGYSHIDVELSSFSTIILFLLASISEETIFRGYIETRLTSITHNSLLASILTAIFFVLIHYPIFWAISGVSFTNLSLFHICLLLILHFFCSVVYKRTNSLWGAILLHFIYNFGTSILLLID